MSTDKYQLRLTETKGKGLVDVLFVCGMYKSGTSLAVHLAEKEGYRNIAKETNPHERGFGLSVARYNTNECVILRRINEKLLPSARDKFNALVALESNANMKTPTETNFRMILKYLTCSPKPLVLKDVRFIYTLPIWLRACEMLRLSYRVAFTHRNQDSLIDAWDNAPFTKEILCRSLIGNLQALLDLRAQECGRLCHVYELEDLKLMLFKTGNK